MTNCPKCQKPILNEGVFTSAASFNMRCPWCQATLGINVKPKIVTEVIKLANGDPYRPAPSGNQNNEAQIQDPFKKPQFRLVGYLYPADETPKDTTTAAPEIRPEGGSGTG